MFVIGISTCLIHKTQLLKNKCKNKLHNPAVVVNACSSRTQEVDWKVILS